MTSGDTTTPRLSVVNLDTPILVSFIAEFFSGAAHSQIFSLMSSFHADTAARFYRNAFFGQGTGPIHYDRVACSGNEPNIGACTKFNPSSTSDSHAEDAGVKCWPTGM